MRLALIFTEPFQAIESRREEAGGGIGKPHTFYSFIRRHYPDID